MKGQGIISSFRHLRVGLLAIAGLIVLSGCSSTTSRVQTWDGNAENADQVAVLSAPGAIKVGEVNGKSMTSFLIDDLNVEYELLPGKNQIVFTYKTIWSKAQNVQDGESKVHVVETPRQVVTIDAEPGAVYRFDAPKPEDRQEALALVENFSVDLVNASGQTVATSSPWTAASTQVAATKTPVPESPSYTAPAASDAGTTLEQLKALWGKASEEEKRKFLGWAFD
ncbi:DUF2057 family protein [Marinobacter halotolerans]|uniref:DUF2057 family protein n=1 Tax=Marinobacter halotolerans TaxID=1569211 RepID=UPI001243DED2|nr:DUF2057 family protein [Marinobacter halotolerans]